jgi:hypothetical protein
MNKKRRMMLQIIKEKYILLQMIRNIVLVNSEQTSENSEQTSENSEQTSENSEQNSEQTSENSEQTSENSEQNSEQTSENSEQTPVNNEISCAFTTARISLKNHITTFIHDDWVTEQYDRNMTVTPSRALKALEDVYNLYPDYDSSRDAIELYKITIKNL